jgi:hypothetical protein
LYVAELAAVDLPVPLDGRRQRLRDGDVVRMAVPVRIVAGRFIIDGLIPMEANLYALDAAPAAVFVEICGAETTVLPVRSAYGLGLALVSLGKAGGGAA